MNFRNTEDPVDVEDVEDRRGAGLCLEIHTSAEGLQRDGGARCAAAGATQQLAVVLSSGHEGTRKTSRKMYCTMFFYSLLFVESCA